MKLKDIATCVGLALLVMVLNVAAAFGWVWIYATFIETGHDQAFYEAYAQQSSPVSSVFVGIALMFAAGWFMGRGRDMRTAAILGLIIAGTYVAIDAAVLLMAKVQGSIWTWALYSWGTKLAAAVLGARLGARVRRPAA